MIKIQIFILLSAIQKIVEAEMEFVIILYNITFLCILFRRVTVLKIFNIHVLIMVSAKLQKIAANEHMR